MMTLKNKKTQLSSLVEKMQEATKAFEEAKTKKKCLEAQVKAMDHELRVLENQKRVQAGEEVDFIEKIMKIRSLHVKIREFFRLYELPAWASRCKPIVLAAVKNEPSQYHAVSIELKLDLDICLLAPFYSLLKNRILGESKQFMYKAVQVDGTCIVHASTWLKNNQTIVEKAVQNNGAAFLYAGDGCRSNKDIFAIAALNKNFKPRKNLSQGSVLLTRVNKDVLNAIDLSNADDFKIAAGCIEKQPRSIPYAPPAWKKSKALWQICLEKDGSMLQYATGFRGDLDMIKLAMKTDPSNVKYSYRRAFARKAVRNAALQASPGNVFYFDRKDIEKAVLRDPKLLLLCAGDKLDNAMGAFDGINEIFLKRVIEEDKFQSAKGKNIEYVMKSVCKMRWRDRSVWKKLGDKAVKAILKRAIEKDSKVLGLFHELMKPKHFNYGSKPTHWKKFSVNMDFLAIRKDPAALKDALQCDWPEFKKPEESLQALTDCARKFGVGEVRPNVHEIYKDLFDKNTFGFPTYVHLHSDSKQDTRASSSSAMRIDTKDVGCAAAHRYSSILGGEPAAKKSKKNVEEHVDSNDFELDIFSW